MSNVTENIPKELPDDRTAEHVSERPAKSGWIEAGDWPALLILIAASLMLLVNLGNQYLWQDEAQTALLSRTVLTHHIPVGYDGTNFFSQESGAEYGNTSNYIWRWHTWFPFYLLAMFFALFGESTFVARLPFALAGIATVGIVYALGRSLWGTRRAGITAAVLLTTSVPFLLLARQCRYYSLTALFSMPALYGYMMLIQRRRGGTALFVTSAMLLFHTHYPYCGALLATVVVHSLIFHRNRILSVLIWSGAVLAVNVPCLIWLLGHSLGNSLGSTMTTGFYLYSMQTYLTMIAAFMFPPVLVALPVALGAIDKVRRGGIQRPDPCSVQGVALLLLFSLFTISILSIANPAPFFRYLAPLLPAFCLIAALLIAKFHPALNLCLVLALALVSPTYWYGAIFCSERYALPAERQPVLSNFWYELTHDYDGPSEGVVEHLAVHGKPTDIVAVTCSDLTLKFYTEMRVVGGLTGEDLTPALNADWLIISKFTTSDKDRAVKQYLTGNLPLEDYEPVALDYPDIPFENREDPMLHRYRTIEYEEPVVIWRLIK